MLRIPYSEVLDPDRPFVAWSLGMRSNQFSNCTQRGTEGNTSYAVKGRNSQCGKAITDGGICSWCDLLGKPECGVTGKSSLSLTKMPDISFQKRREVHCSMIQLHPRCRLRGGVVRRGEPWHGVQGRGCQRWFHHGMAVWPGGSHFTSLSLFSPSTKLVWMSLEP